LATAAALDFDQEHAAELDGAGDRRGPGDELASSAVSMIVRSRRRSRNCQPSYVPVGSDRPQRDPTNGVGFKGSAA
jgi:hypothetical protein